MCSINISLIITVDPLSDSVPFRSISSLKRARTGFSVQYCFDLGCFTETTDDLFKPRFSSVIHFASLLFLLASVLMLLSPLKRLKMNLSCSPIKETSSLCKFQETKERILQVEEAQHSNDLFQVLFCFFLRALIIPCTGCSAQPLIRFDHFLFWVLSLSKHFVTSRTT